MARRCLHDAIDKVRGRWPFVIEELVLLPDHFHIILTLPEDDCDFSMRIGRIKSAFTRAYLAAGGRELGQSTSRDQHGYRGVWQKRFWEQLPWSTFHRAVARRWIDRDWCCVRGGRQIDSPVKDIPGAEMD